MKFALGLLLCRQAKNELRHPGGDLSNIPAIHKDRLRIEDGKELHMDLIVRGGYINGNAPMVYPPRNLSRPTGTAGGSYHSPLSNLFNHRIFPSTIVLM
jgi:hypothetical protein